MRVIIFVLSAVLSEILENGFLEKSDNGRRIPSQSSGKVH
jgi:hypothetical protein